MKRVATPDTPMVSSSPPWSLPPVTGRSFAFSRTLRKGTTQQTLTLGCTRFVHSVKTISPTPPAPESCRRGERRPPRGNTLPSREKVPEAGGRTSSECTNSTLCIFPKGRGVPLGHPLSDTLEEQQPGQLCRGKLGEWGPHFSSRCFQDQLHRDRLPAAGDLPGAQPQRGPLRSGQRSPEQRAQGPALAPPAPCRMATLLPKQLREGRFPRLPPSWFRGHPSPVS